MEAINQFLCKFFFEILKNYFLNDDSVKAAGADETSSENRKKCEKEKIGKDKLNIVRDLLSQPLTEQNIACFYECNVCLASSTAKTFFELLKKNSDFFQRKITRKSINICCIAGGIASEIVAIIQVLCMEMRNSKMDFLNFQVTFISDDDKWRKKIEIVMKELQERMIEDKKIKITPSFVRLHDDLEVTEVFHNTDILISTQFSQEIIGFKKREYKQLLKVAFNQMRCDSLFYFLETFGDGLIGAVEKTISKFNFFDLVYKNSGHHSTAVKDLLNLYSDYFGADLHCSYCSYSVRAWRKLDRKTLPGETSTSASVEVYEKRKKKGKRNKK